MEATAVVLDCGPSVLRAGYANPDSLPQVVSWHGRHGKTKGEPKGGCGGECW